jgi:hypothetical protein
LGISTELKENNYMTKKQAGTKITMAPEVIRGDYYGV